jgi:hypothetical protein
MAHITHREALSCRCCGLKARRTDWSCGCVTIDFDSSARACGDCDDFSSLRRRCGKPGPPGS